MSIPPSLAPVVRSADLRLVETAARAAPLMERAGLAAAEVARTLADERSGAILVLAGPGNNGGDAFVVARWLRGWFFDVCVVCLEEPAKLPPDAAAAYQAFVAAGGSTTARVPDGWQGTLIVDGLFGIGLTRAPSAKHAKLIEWANASGVPILALDVPSGLDADTGTAHAPAIRAAATATFIALKPGLLTGDGVDLCGAVSVHGLDIDGRLLDGAKGRFLTWSALAAGLPRVLRRGTRNVHKGTFGTLGIVGGAEGMVGAPLLAGRAALHSGAGRVRVGIAARPAPPLDWGQPELMLRPAEGVLDADANALVCGPGLGTDEIARSLVARAVAMAVPLVLDADALNVVARDPALAAAVAARRAPTLATPHPAEAGRLLGTTPADVQRDRLGAALTLSVKLNAALVLKGAGSVLAYPDGAWDVNGSGNAGLATAGTGDVLAGFAGAFLAQGIDAKDALRLAVCLHGAAADACVANGVGPLGLTAAELAPAARRLLNDAARPAPAR